MRRSRSLLLTLVAASSVWCADFAWSQELGEAQCGSLANAVGPLDYNLKSAEAVSLLGNVEYNHMNQNVRSLQGGQTAVGPMGDLDYVLRAFPNHPQALMLVARYQAGGGSRERFRSADCYFDRALRFVPNDPTVHMLYAMHLARQEKNEQALERYQEALALLPDYAEAHYNIGLLLVKMKRLDEARTHAEKAYALGYPLEGLRRQLIRLNAWGEPRSTPTASSAGKPAE